MIADSLPFERFVAPRPSAAQVAERYEALEARFRAAGDEGARRAALGEWERARREFATFGALARLRFRQNTADASARADRELADRLQPSLLERDARLKRHCLERGEQWLPLVGEHTFALWRADLVSFAPDVADEVLEEQELAARYTELVGAASIDFEGAPRTLPELMRHAMDHDRDRREAAERARWGWFATHAEELDALYARLVVVRDAMATKLGYVDYVALSYDRRRRIGYDRQDVERFRANVIASVVPLCTEMARERAARLGLPRLRTWDEKIHAGGHDPAPRGDQEFVVERTIRGLAELSPKIGSFAEGLRARGLLDLASRPGKSVGGFCTQLWDFDTPFVFANFNGSRQDVRVLIHELGHAFQHGSSRGLDSMDLESCTSESAEVHSMSLEFLAWPRMEFLFGDDAERFRAIHLAEQLFFLPYGCAIDHFQHEVYARPSATPRERHAVWRELEQVYLPWRDHADLPHAASGGAWQAQLHVYTYPFYYIDYVLAATCALQLWAVSLNDHAQAMAAYEALCARGGSLPFARLVESAGLVSPFAPGCLDGAVAEARAWLERVARNESVARGI